MALMRTKVRSRKCNGILNTTHADIDINLLAQSRKFGGILILTEPSEVEQKYRSINGIPKSKVIIIPIKPS